MSDEELVAQFLARKGVTKVAEGRSVLAEQKAAKAHARAQARARREARMQREEDLAEFQALVRDNMRDV